MTVARHDWLIVTPEYPPGCGGIGDYTKLLAEQLVGAGDRVSVWTPPSDAPRENGATPSVYTLPDHFGLRSARALGDALAHTPPDTVLLVQYVPHGFGWRGMNVGFCAWLGARRERTWLMVHEPLYPFVKGQPFRHDVLASTTWLMLRLVAHGAERIFVSTPAWESFLPPGSAGAEWLPIPASVVPVAWDSAGRPAARPTVAHFGTYGGHLEKPLREIFGALVEQRPDVGIHLLGRNSETFRELLLREHPAAAERVVASGAASAEAIVEALASAWVVVFPFIEGVSTRRTSLMSALAAGAAIVTTQGWCSESIWRSSGAVELVEIGRSEAAVGAVLGLLGDEPRRRELRERARRLYNERFHFDRVVERLRALRS